MPSPAKAGSDALSAAGKGAKAEKAFVGAAKYGIDIENLQFSKTVLAHTGRPYQDSKLLINEIIESGTPIPDPQGTNALKWVVDGSFNGSSGTYEILVVCVN